MYKNGSVCGVVFVVGMCACLTFGSFCLWSGGFDVRAALVSSHPGMDWVLFWDRGLQIRLISRQIC